MQLYLYLFFIIFIALIVFYKYNLSSKEIISELISKNTRISLINPKSDHKVSDLNMIINNEVCFDKILEKGELGLAESYMDGDWDTDDLEGIIKELLMNEEILIDAIKYKSLELFGLKLYASVRTLLPKNNRESIKSDISHHYDIGNDLYDKMLGEHMQYTCAYFYKPDMTLDEAQYAKMELVAKKLDLRPGMKVLDIGCGFGSMGNHLATKYGVHVTGVTLSKEQVLYSKKKYDSPNLEVKYLDYRDCDDIFDRVYSVGMFEHVGRRNYHEYFDKCNDLLKDDGIMLLHTIGGDYRKWDADDCFLMKYIFPGAEIPHLENMTGKFIDKWHMEDFHNFGLSYAKTLRAWHKNIGDWKYLDNYDSRFRRMWDFYLLECAATFQTRKHSLWQFVFTKRNSKRLDDCHHIRIN